MKALTAVTYGPTGHIGENPVRLGEKWMVCMYVLAPSCSRSVGIKAVREVVGSLPHHRCQRGLAVTNQRFASAARQLAREHGVCCGTAKR